MQRLTSNSRFGGGGGWPPQLGVAPEGQVEWHGELPYHHNPLERNS
jgi:hypothetical protein